jgi:hypothetical protein
MNKYFYYLNNVFKILDPNNNIFLRVLVMKIFIMFLIIVTLFNFYKDIKLMNNKILKIVFK